MANRCNGYNHHPLCDCGWGGREGEAKIARSRARGTRSSWAFLDDFCRSTTCPRCQGQVYFIRHNGGSVWLDALGPPWPKHGCFHDYVAYKLNADLNSPNRQIFGIVVETEVIEPGRSGRIVIRCSDGSVIDANFTMEWDLVALIGRLVTVERDSNGGVTIHRV